VPQNAGLRKKLLSAYLRIFIGIAAPATLAQ
jgi:hypothetical protein